MKDCALNAEYQLAVIKRIMVINYKFSPQMTFLAFLMGKILQEDKRLMFGVDTAQSMRTIQKYRLYIWAKWLMFYQFLKIHSQFFKSPRRRWLRQSEIKTRRLSGKQSKGINGSRTQAMLSNSVTKQRRWHCPQLYYKTEFFAPNAISVRLTCVNYRFRNSSRHQKIFILV